MPAQKTNETKKTTKTCMVIKAGADRISTGERVDNADVTYPQKAKFEATPSQAKALEERGFVEIMD